MVRKILCTGSQFLFVCFNEKDGHIDVMSSQNLIFHISIPKKLEPTTLAVLDLAQTDQDKYEFGQRLAIIGSCDTEFFYDLLNPQDSN